MSDAAQNPPQISIVIPICNEEALLARNVTEIRRQLKEIRGLDWEIILIENGSTDQTLQIAEQLSEDPSIQTISLLNANYGIALQTGFLKASGSVIVNFDIDYWDVEFVDIVSHVMKVKYDIIIASKNLLLSKDRRGILRKVASYGFRMILFFMFGLRVSDTHGIKAWRNSEKMQSYFRQAFPAHHTFDTEVIIRAMYDQCEVLEIPVEVIEMRTSDHHILKRVPQALKELLAIRKRLNHEKLSE
ncbi:MAG: glycosyltransferase [SAR324 cluster bacterium]|nr:glycosyltransferase [SAR324 cluster bacterium]